MTMPAYRPDGEALRASGVRVVPAVGAASGAAMPRRAGEALAVGVPVVASDTDVHREVVLDGGAFADAGGLGESLAGVLVSAAAVERFSVLAADRGRAFSWAGAAERVWQLHADL